LCGKNDVDDVMIKYNFNCHDLNILPSTEILNFFVDNSLIIQNTFISFELSECIAKFISQNYQENEMFKIDKIFIDGCQIDDHKLYEILKSINGNKKQQLKSVTFLNIKLGKKSMSEMEIFLKSLKELKLANVFHKKNSSFKITLDILENLNSLNLESLHLSYIDLNNYKIIEKINKLIQSPFLKDLNLSFSRINQKFLSQLFFQLKELSGNTLNNLSLRGLNSFNDSCEIKQFEEL
jgi:hypothetical protein